MRYIRRYEKRDTKGERSLKGAEWATNVAIINDLLTYPMIYLSHMYSSILPLCKSPFLTILPLSLLLYLESVFE